VRLFVGADVENYSIWLNHTTKFETSFELTTTWEYMEIKRAVSKYKHIFEIEKLGIKGNLRAFC